MIYEKKANKALARAEYQAALKLDPDLKDAKEALVRRKLMKPRGLGEHA